MQVLRENKPSIDVAKAAFNDKRFAPANWT